MEYVEMDELLMPIADNCGEFDIANFKELFNTAIISYVLQERILSSAKELLGKQVLTGFNTLIRERHKAISINAKECAKCRGTVEIVTGVEFVPFSCGHIYHPDCVGSFSECEVCLLTGKSNPHCMTVGMLPLDRSRSKLEAKLRKEEVKGDEKSGNVKKKVDKKKEFYRSKFKEFEKSRAQPFVVLLLV
eukprot:TRINITY_DN3826_c0_g1_i7.p2 TRINITY_DN3826_c0_g1~~TRINITY_DN3826_c0_g1_i7.p2  ORF type:complete len:190 (+),score=49.34 TRINITY_DN3826_c0_g1_i7:1072-1641(+)